MILGTLRRIDELAVRAADILIVDTEEHLAELPASVRSRAVVVPVGAPNVWFGSPPSATGLPLRVIFFGLYTPLQGTPLIGEAIGSLAGAPIRFTMVGQGQDLERTRAAAMPNPNVRWLRWIGSERLPDAVMAHDICLGIFGTSAKAMCVVPNKVFQGAAAGCAIVTSNTQPQRRALGEAAAYVPPGDSEALATVLWELARQPERVQALRLAAHDRAARAFRPSAVVKPLRQRLASHIET
jgi:glycosyltransferase involved in cell wall biosynthesis